MSEVVQEPWREHVLARQRQDRMLRWIDLFAQNSPLLVSLCLHLELLETATQLSDERVTQLKLQWWIDTLSSPALRDRHPLTARSAMDSRAAEALVNSLLQIPELTPAGSFAELWQQALQLAAPCAALTQTAPGWLAGHGLLWRLRLPLAGAHNPGLCPLDLRARFQLAERLPPAQWPQPLLRTWCSLLAEALSGTGCSGSAGVGEPVLAALLLRETRLAADRADWRPTRIAHGVGAVWTAWRAAVRA